MDVALDFKIPILGYHSGDTPGTSYATNDRVAFAADLELIKKLGFSVLPLPTLFDWFLSGDHKRLSDGKYVVLTMDDGPICDYLDVDSVPSMNNLLRKFVKSGGRVVGEGPLATSFVIASPEMRRQSNPKTLNDFWWKDCVLENLIGIGSHSWDHCAPEIHPVAQKDQIKGTFRFIDTFSDADIQFRQAREYIESVIDAPCLYFAFPWGERCKYLIEEYLPNHQNEHKYLGCVTVDAAYVTRKSSRWEMPRFVCRSHWQSSEQLERILLGSQKQTVSYRRTAVRSFLRTRLRMDSVASWLGRMSASLHRNDPLKLEDFLIVVEVDDSALFFVGDLIKRRFNAEGPRVPRHFVAFYRAGPSQYWPVGYVHQTPWEGCHLCGALVVDEILIKKMRPEHRKFIYEQHGGVAERLLRESFRRVLGNSKAIWGHVGNERALKVDTRVGFRPTEHLHLMVVWNDKIVKEEEKAELIKKAHAIGVF